MSGINFSISDKRTIAGNDQPSPTNFNCIHCGATIPSRVPGSKHRNHCPSCLWSKHVDHHSGDRKSNCSGAMRPIAISVDPKGEWSILHRCTKCGMIRINRIAGDDSEFALFSLAAQPLSHPPFPLMKL